MTRPASKTSGFTLIELLIVVVILSTLAAIVVPQFASSSDSAKIAAAKSSVAGIRSALEVYRTEKGDYPLVGSASDTLCSGFTLTTATASNTDVVLLELLSNYSNSDGEICNTKSPVHPQGPYLRMRQFPDNPLAATNKNLITKSSLGTLGVSAGTAPATDNGWKYQPLTGEFIINITAYEND